TPGTKGKGLTSRSHRDRRATSRRTPGPSTATPPRRSCSRRPRARPARPERLPGRAEEESHGICYVRYESELQMPWIMRRSQRTCLSLIQFTPTGTSFTTGRSSAFWPWWSRCVGAIVCKLDMHKKMFRRGYIAMLAVDSKHRRKSIGTNLVKKAIYAMVEGDCDEVVLETEITNKSALKLYENLGFVRDKRLFRYYLNGVDALRLKLWLR
ncbi:hypothetical protein KUCAC02_019928, partial [Chaenocephalus aceratus]